MNDMLDQMDYHAARAALAWQLELGADEAICDSPINRYEVGAEMAAAQAERGRSGKADHGPKPAQAPVNVVEDIAKAQEAAVQQARDMAAAAGDLEALRAAMAAYEHCDLKLGARNLVFSDGNPAARVMILGEAPGRDEDLQGKPFVGVSGQLLDQMFAAIGLARTSEQAESALYISNILPWRPPHNADPTLDQIGMLMPFVARHVELVQPEVIVAVGNISCQGLLGRKGITRLRGQWAEALGRPVLPMFHPAYLLRTPTAKRASWQDLLALQARLRDGAA